MSLKSFLHLTPPGICTTQVSNLSFSTVFWAFEITVIVGFCGPTLFLAVYLTEIFPRLPGAIGSLGLVGTVQPQEPFTSMMTKSAVPVFVNSKAFSTTASS